jgi:two-component system, chemotaxis family, protein-glutamate methylesterase/glutaminase
MDKSKDSRLVVIGTSAGGIEALKKLLAQLPQDFPAPVFIVMHMGADSDGEVFVRVLKASGGLPCQLAQDGQAFKSGHVYLAPPDQHMLIARGKLMLSKGARENRFRPAIDPLFRSAAVTYGNHVIGIILTGYLDDGTSGMLAIKRCGGICVAQDLNDALYPDMPQSVITNVGADYCVPIAQMGALLAELVGKEPPASKKIPEDLVIEAKIAQRVVSDLPAVEMLGDKTPFTCPDCGGTLWEKAEAGHLKYRCHVGHAFTPRILLAQQTEKIEETLWVALRMFEERQNLLEVMSKQERGKARPSFSQRITDSKVHIDRIRAILQANGKDSIHQGDVIAASVATK